MKKAVGYLTPFMEEEKKAAIVAAGGDPNQPTYAGKVLLATVKGDVHEQPVVGHLTIEGEVLPY